MRTGNLMTFMVLAALSCLIFASVDATAAKGTVALDGQVRALDFSKSVPGNLNYQGYLVDTADSSAVTATLEMTFRLYDAATAGTEQWAETQAQVPVIDGLFSTLLGSVTPFPGGLFDGSLLWLQTEVGAEVLTPRKPLVSVAYSHRAEQADHATTAEWSTGAQHAVHADTADYCPGISAWTVDGDDIYRETGNVGIGTTSPGRQLHIYDDTDDATATIETGGTTNSWAQTRYKTASKEWIVGTSRDYNDNELYIDDGSSALHLNADGTNGFRVGSDGGKYLSLRTGSVDAVYISSAGNVGIGTTSPSYTLDVNGAVQATTYHGDGSNLTGIAGAPDADWTINGNDIYHETGNVGIGTTGPTAPLTIHAVSGTDILFTSSGNNTDIKAASEFRIGTSSAHNVHLLTNDTFRLTVTSGGGRVGIGTTMPTKLLDVAGGIQADTLSLGSSSKAGMDGHFHMYRDGSSDPILAASDYSDDGGRIDLYDEAANWTVRLEPDVNGTGGFLEVERSAGSWGFMVDGNSAGTEEPWVSINGSARSVDFYMSRSGDSSVVLPNSAISAGEIKDEPGVSNSLGQDYVYLNAGNIDYVIDTVAITLPGPGYVEVTGGCYLNMRHSNGTDTRVFVAIDKTPASASYTFPGATIASIPALIASSDWQFPSTTTRLYEEASGGTIYYYLNADYKTGTSTLTNVARAYIRAKYYPTLYGTVTVAETDGLGDELTASQNPGDGSEHTPEPRRRSITVQQHNARLEAKLATMRAELDALKQEVRNQRR